MKTFFCTLILISTCLWTAGRSGILLGIEPKETETRITSMSETEKFIWFGTDHGVVRMSKKSGKKQWITTKNSELPSNHITSIACAPDGRAWIGTGMGILYWDNYHYIRIDSKNSNLADDCITAMAFDKSGFLWVGTQDGGLSTTHGFHFTPCKKNNYICDGETISSITVDANGTVWVGLFLKGLLKIAPDKCTMYPMGESGLLVGNVKFVLIENNGNYTIGTADQGCYSFDGAVFSPIVNKDITSMKICNAFRDCQNTVTVYLCEDGCCIFKNSDYF